jgi:hypothetical protein
MYVICSNPLYDLSTHQLCTIGTVLWSISKSTLDTDIIRSNFASARARALHKLSRPEGVALQEMENFWHGLQFNPAAPVEVPFKTALFRTPPRSVKFLRRLAQQGRAYLKHSIREQRDKPKRVLGIPNDAEMVAPLVAQAHRRIADASKLPVPGTAKTLSRKQRKILRLKGQRRKRISRAIRTVLARSCAP